MGLAEVIITPVEKWIALIISKLPPPGFAWGYLWIYDSQIAVAIYNGIRYNLS
jgi:hypothetical protein